jgi:hypothetical protein
MSSDLDLYEDNYIGISATLGHWGVRLSVDQKIRDPKYPNAMGVMGDLLTEEKLDFLRASLIKIKEHLALLKEDQ